MFASNRACMLILYAHDCKFRLFRRMLVSGENKNYYWSIKPLDIQILNVEVKVEKDIFNY